MFKIEDINTKQQRQGDKHVVKTNKANAFVNKTKFK